MSDLNRRALQPIYDYCRSCLPQFALAIREADDEIEKLEAVHEAAKKWASQEDYDGFQLLDALAALEEDDD